MILKYGLRLLIVLMILQLITISTIAEKEKKNAIIQDLRLYYYTSQIDSFSFHTNMINDNMEFRDALKARFKDTLSYIEICDIFTWSKHRIDSNYFALEIIDQSQNNFEFEAYTYAGTLYYGEAWYNQYVWLLFKWFKVKHENIGIS